MPSLNKQKSARGLWLFTFVGFAACLVFIPVPLASNRDWAWSPLAAVIGLLLMSAAVSIALQPEAARRLLANLEALLMPSLLAALGIGWAFVQISGWTPESWATFVSAAAVLGPETNPHTVAFNREAVLTGLMRLMTNIAFFILGVMLGAQTRDARRLLGTIVIAASVYTLYAMVAQAANSQAVWTGASVWVPAPPDFTGTFINRNNYATYAGVAAIAALCLALRPRKWRDEETARQRWRRRLAALSGVGALWLAAALVLIVGVLFSASRGGAISLAVSLLTMVFIYTRGAKRIAAVMATMMLLGSAVFLLPGAAQLVGRSIALATYGEENREALYAIVIQAIGLRPLIGWGLNSYSSTFSMLQPASLPVYYDKAHNTYLELAFDLGIPAASALILAVVLIVVRCLRGFYERGRDPELAGVGFLVAVLAGFHAFFDFSLQIPAMACTFFAILGIAWAQSWSGRRPGSAESAEAN